MQQKLSWLCAAFFLSGWADCTLGVTPASLLPIFQKYTEHLELKRPLVHESPAQYPFVSTSTRYKAHSLLVPISHFPEDAHYAPHVNATFHLRYWCDKTYWRGSGPIFILDGGETSGQSRTPYLSTGILSILAKETGGLGLVLEHRYYGQSLPFNTSDSDSMRFLTTQQSMADSAYFIQHVEIPEVGRLSRSTPVIYYGGSYGQLVLSLTAII